MQTTPSDSTISQALAHAVQRGLPRLDAQLLVLHALGRNGSAGHDRAWLLAHDTDALSAQAQARLEHALARRLAGEPLAYITGHKEFFGLDLQVDARVLVPRPDTETLVEWALEVLTGDANSVIDLGTGSGAIALALKQTRPALHVHAVDASANALAVAQANAHRLGLEVHFAQGSWLSGVVHKFHAIVSNPPYIAQDDHHLAALTHEPLQALASGVDGLDDIRTLVSQARVHLHPGGWLLLEHGHEQAASVRALLQAAGYAKVQSRCDLAGIQRCSGGQM